MVSGKIFFIVVSVLALSAVKYLNGTGHAGKSSEKTTAKEDNRRQAN